jgi:hypothetical protein
VEKTVISTNEMTNRPIAFGVPVSDDVARLLVERAVVGSAFMAAVVHRRQNTPIGAALWSRMAELDRRLSAWPGYPEAYLDIVVPAEDELHHLPGQEPGCTWCRQGPSVSAESAPPLPRRPGSRTPRLLPAPPDRLLSPDSAAGSDGVSVSA